MSEPMPHGIKHDRSQKLIDYAYWFAMTAHGDQVRKYTGEPYINHCVTVARILAEYTDDVEIICAGLLHDTIEDTGTTKDTLIAAGFGHTIAQLVVEVSDVSRPWDGNRAHRKHLDRQHLWMASPRGMTVKLADVLDNGHDIMIHDPDFAVVYMDEIRQLLPGLDKGNPDLYRQATQMVEKYFEPDQ